MDHAAQSSGMLYGSPFGSGRRRTLPPVDPDEELFAQRTRAQRRVDELIAEFDADPIPPGRDEIARHLEEDMRSARLSILMAAAGYPETWWSEEDLQRHARAQYGSSQAGPIWVFALRRLVEDGYLERDESDAVRISL